MLAKNIDLPILQNPSTDLRPNDIILLPYHGVSIRRSERYDNDYSNNYIGMPIFYTPK